MHKSTISQTWSPFSFSKQAKKENISWFNAISLSGFNPSTQRDQEPKGKNQECLSPHFRKTQTYGVICGNGPIYVEVHTVIYQHKRSACTPRESEERIVTYHLMVCTPGWKPSGDHRSHHSQSESVHTKWKFQVLQVDVSLYVRHEQDTVKCRILNNLHRQEIITWKLSPLLKVWFEEQKSLTLSGSER